MRRVRALPMKPLTPKIRIFMRFLCDSSYGADLCVPPFTGAHAGAPLRKSLPHQVFPGGHDRTQKFRLVLPLGLGDEEVAVARGHHEPFSGERGGDAAGGLRGRQGRGHGPAVPDKELSPRQGGKGAGVGVSHGSHQIIDARGGLAPVDLTVCGPAAAEVGGLGVVLGEALRLAAPQARVGLPEQLPRGRGHPGQEGGGGVFRDDGKAMLGHDVAPVGFGFHVMQGDAGFGFAVNQDPVHRTAAPVAGQEAAVEIQGPQAGQVQDRLLQHVAIIARKQPIRLQSLHGGHEGRVIGVGRLIHRQVVIKGQLPHRGEPQIFFGIIGMGDHRHDLVAQLPAQLDERLQAGVADIVVTQKCYTHIFLK
jgi:hypothetical protein